MSSTPLPVNQAKTQTPVKPHSKRGLWRAGVLLAIHLAIAIHLWHWKTNGETVTPVEPSEAMQTLELGMINAGFIFFALAILSTLILGRWFCGWGCHIVALQDFCGWILKKAGMRPKPIRSRFLVWVPVFAAFYMFAWPQLVRLVDRRAAPAWVWHLTTTDFWATFPNWQISLLTFAVCGFLVVILLGNKGFCTYGCPYGGIFFWADKVAPGKIRVTEACNQCGHCTAVCTSNVRVHEEVKLHKMVVDAGCMKCFDCVDACPNDALYFGFGSPRPSKKQLAQLPMAQTKVWDFSIAEEVALALLFIVALYVFRGLYDSIPFLLSLGLSAITAFVYIHLGRVFYARHVRLQRMQWKAKGRILPAGWAALAAGAILTAFLGHCFFIQIYAKEGTRLLELAQAEYQSKDPSRMAKAESFSRSAKMHLTLAVNYGLWPIAEWESKLGSIAQFLGERDEALARFSRALELDPSRDNTRMSLLENLLLAKSESAYLEQYAHPSIQSKLQPRHHLAAANYCVAKQQYAEAETAYRKVLAAEPKNSVARLNLGLLLAQNQQLGEAETLLQQLVSDEPENGPAWQNLGLVQATTGKIEAAQSSLKTAITIDPKLEGAWMAFIQIGQQTAGEELAWSRAKQAYKAIPNSPAIRQALLSLATTPVRKAELGALGNPTP